MKNKITEGVFGKLDAMVRNKKLYKVKKVDGYNFIKR